MQKTFSSLGKFLVGLLVAGGVACSGDTAAPLVATIPATAVENTAVPPTPKPTETNAGPTSEPEPATPTIQPTDKPTNEAAAPSAPESIEVTYYTPAQGEGPYYIIGKPDDYDNDLTTVPGSVGVPAGQLLEFSGRLYDAAGTPVEGAVIEIWQTDANGIYDHPGDPDTARRDVNFQFYGEAVTAVDGRYNFRTILPGEYEPRPRHIHVKVKLNGQELLTTQFYFEGDPALAGERMFTDAAGDGVHLVMSLVEGQDANGNPILIGERDIVLSITLANN